MKKKPSSEAKSFAAAIEQMAKLLRSEIKLKDRQPQVLSSSAMPGSLTNSILQVAKLLKNQIRQTTPLKKRSWNMASQKKEKK